MVKQEERNHEKQYGCSLVINLSKKQFEGKLGDDIGSIHEHTICDDGRKFGG